MRKLNLTDLNPLVAQGLIKLKSHPTLPIMLACYTQQQFLSGEWGEVAKRCRGTLFDRLTGEQLTQPIPKIFNIGEKSGYNREQVDNLLSKGEYTVHHKANGHLVICNYVYDQWVITTKGSFDMEFLDFDIPMVKPYLEKIKPKEISNGFCICFESIHENDKHTMYESEVERFGENVPVLLYASLPTTFNTFVRCHNHYLLALADVMGCSTTILSRCTKSDIIEFPVDRAYRDHETEGYVLYFNTGQMVKIKTEIYLMERARRELSAGGKWKKIFRHCYQGNGDYREEVAEEFWPLFEYIVNDYRIGCMAYLSLAMKMVQMNNIFDKKRYFELDADGTLMYPPTVQDDPEAKKILGHLILGVMNGKACDFIFKNIAIKHRYMENVNFDKLIEDYFKKGL